MERGLSNIISSRFGIFYAVTDLSLNVKFPDSRLVEYLACGICMENEVSLQELFPEVIGIENEIIEVIKGERESVSIRRINRTAGEEIFFNLHFFSDIKGSGYSYVVVEDITENSISFREAQQRRNEVVLKNLELVKREEFINTLLDTIPAPIFYRDSKGICLGCNRGFEEFTSKSRSDIIGSDINFITARGAELLRFDDELLKSGGIRSYEAGISDGKGEERHVMISKSIFFGPDINSRVIVSAIVDITERKVMEEQLRTALTDLALSKNALSQKIEIMENNLLIARKAVDTLIQKEFPETEGVEIECSYLPLEQIGGDYYSVVSFDGFTGVFVCDITGHGVASALFLSLIKYFTENLDQWNWIAPSEYLSLINREYFKGNTMFYFFSAIAGSIVHGEKMEFRFANGGHPHPVIMKRSGEVFFAGGNNAVIGIFEEQKFDEFRIELDPGDMLFLYTDGIPSTSDINGSIIGFDDSLLELFKRARKKTLKETVKSVIDEVILFRGENRQEDDILLLGFYIN
ncbi:MAG TPA: SpoIIE family protein phosphatase [Spirochaetota bacterium]|nr:SpoIIE family protein phosphatase [Spirochaetota bacterium]HPJ33217.1 SpoIIE family protein phosphatase [Spirochaetota bacterium]